MFASVLLCLFLQRLARVKQDQTLLGESAAASERPVGDAAMVAENESGPSTYMCKGRSAGRGNKFTRLI